MQSLSLPLSSVSKFRHPDDDYEDDEEEEEEDGDEEEDGSDLDQIDEDGDYDVDSFDDESADRINADNFNSSIPANSTIVTSVLHLNNVDHSDAGRYQCIVSNKFGATYSHRFKVSVASESFVFSHAIESIIDWVLHFPLPFCPIQQRFQCLQNGRPM